MTRATLYARYSTDAQSEASIADQLRVCREHAAARGWIVTGEFTDEAISGAAIGNRPGVQRALAAVASGDVLLVCDLSRLARSQDLAPLIARLRHRGARVVGVQDAFDSETRTARMQAGLSGIMSEEFRAMVADRTRAALESRAKSGSATGGRAYGYDDAGQPREPEASVAREIFGRYAAGETMKAIVCALNARGVPSPGASWKREQRRGDGRWMLSAVHAILHNERYVGRVVWNRSTWAKDPDTGARVRRERPPSEWVVTQGPALIDRATWEAAQARLTERARAGAGGRGGTARYLLSGILVCRECGGPMIVTGSGGSHYYCGSHRHGGRHACSMDIGARRDVAEDVVLEPVRRDLLSPEAVELAIEEIHRVLRQQRTAAVVGGPELAAVEAEIAELEQLARERPALAASLAPALEAAHDRHTRLQRAAWRRATACPTEAEIPAERAYRAAVAKMAEILRGAIAPARLALRELLGEVPVYPAPEGRWLLADVGVDPRPLMRAAGIGGVAERRCVGADAAFAWDGSGGRIWSRANPLRRAA